MMRFEHASIERDGTHIITDYSMYVSAGELVVLVGANGSGKTTLARTLAGHPGYKVSRGSFLFNQENIIDMSPLDRARRGIFVSLQSAPALEGLAVRFFLYRIYQQRARLKKEEQVSALDFTRMILEPLAVQIGLSTAALEVPFDKLSGGEFKRVELLSYMILQPECAWFDELDSGLDAAGRAVFVSLMSQKRTQYPRRMHVVVTHDLVCAQALGPDRVYILDHGRIVQTGGRETLALYQARFTAEGVK